LSDATSGHDLVAVPNYNLILDGKLRRATITAANKIVIGRRPFNAVVEAADGGQAVAVYE
jgi:hypothetical protein